MPKATGYEVCEYIKQNEELKHIPVMLLVGSFEPFDEAEARRVGADDYLTKPFQSIRQLVERVGTLFGKKYEAEQLPTRQLETPAATETESEGDKQRLELQIADTQPLPDDIAESHFRKTAGLSEQSFADLSDDAPATSVPPKIQNSEGNASEIMPTSELTTDNSQKASVFAGADTGKLAASSNHVATNANHVTTENGLLDLDGIDLKKPSSHEDDFILDLEDEFRPVQSSPDSETEPLDEEWIEEHVPEAMHVGLVSEEPAIAAHENISSGVSSDEFSQSSAATAHSGVTAVSLSPEMIDVIARRVIEMLSTTVIEEIAWEVVPELAEKLIKKRLQEQESR